MKTIFTYAKLYKAYLDCRKNKRKTVNALKFEYDLEENLMKLLDELKNKTYTPGRSICFVVTKPKPREIFAADFRDRIVHHLLVGELLPSAEKRFISDSYACRVGKGTHKAVRKLRKFMKSIANKKRDIYYAQLDVKAFFPNIDQKILFGIVERLILKNKGSDGWTADMLWLAGKIIFHNSAANYYYKGDPKLMALILPEKSLLHRPGGRGLPIGNYSSQFFANLYLNELDYFIKQNLKMKHYVRYVDDLVILDYDKGVLKSAVSLINEFLVENLKTGLNFKKSILEKAKTGIDFLGYFMKPSHTLVRRRVVQNCKDKMRPVQPLKEMKATANSYLGHFLHADSWKLREKMTRGILKN